MTHDEMIAVIQHHKNGGDVECIIKNEPNDRWSSVINPSWNFADCDYRAKPKPMAIYAALYNCGGLCATFTNEEAAADFARKSIVSLTVKKFTEATE